MFTSTSRSRSLLPVTWSGRLRGPQGGLRELAPMPRGARARVWLPLLLVPLLVLTGIGLHRHLSGPTSLTQAHLTGPRSPAPVSVVILVDESGSFTQYTQMRQDLLDQLATWAPENLRPDDMVTVIAFASDAQIRMAPTTVADLQARGPRYQNTPPGGSGTSIQPALEQAEQIAPTGMTSTLIVLSDTLVDDATPQAAAHTAAALNATTMTLMVPDGTDPTPQWSQAFAWEQVISVDPGSLDQTGVAVAQALAHATGQTVTKT